MAETTRVDALGGWGLARPARKATFLGWLLRSRRQISAGFHVADDRHSRPGGGCEEYSGGVAQAGHRSAGGGFPAGGTRIFSRRRSAGDRGFGLWNAIDSARRQDRGPGEHVR